MAAHTTARDDGSVAESRSAQQFSDPLVPVAQRFPMLRSAGPLSDARPSGERPFALRFAVVIEPATVKHRTASHQTTVPARTTLDGRQVSDDYTVPDD